MHVHYHKYHSMSYFQSVGVRQPPLSEEQSFMTFFQSMGCFQYQEITMKNDPDNKEMQQISKIHRIYVPRASINCEKPQISEKVRKLLVNPHFYSLNLSILYLLQLCNLIQ